MKNEVVFVGGYCYCYCYCCDVWNYGDAEIEIDADYDCFRVHNFVYLKFEAIILPPRQRTNKSLHIHSRSETKQIIQGLQCHPLS